MNAKNVLKIASLFLNLTNEFTPIIEEDENATIDTNTQQEFAILLSCLNLTCLDISYDYLPILSTETILVENNKIFFQDLANEPKSIQSITLKSNGKNVKYQIFEDYIKLYANGYVDIVYSISPESITLQSDGILFGGRISDKCLAMGTASEYCYVKGFYEEAAMWDERFKQALQVACRKKSEVVLPRRRWL